MEIRHTVGKRWFDFGEAGYEYVYTAFAGPEEGLTPDEIIELVALKMSELGLIELVQLRQYVAEDKFQVSVLGVRLPDVEAALADMREFLRLGPGPADVGIDVSDTANLNPEQMREILRQAAQQQMEAGPEGGNYRDCPNEDSQCRCADESAFIAPETGGH